MTWDIEISELKSFFGDVFIPVNEFNLSTGEVIENPFIFVLNHLAYVEANNGKEVYYPYLDRLKRFRALLEGYNGKI